MSIGTSIIVTAFTDRIETE